MPKKSAAKNNTNPFLEFLLYPNGGESVSFACASSPAHNLFFIFASFYTMAFVRLIRFAHPFKLRPPVRMGASCSTLRKDLFDDISSLDTVS